MCYQKVASFPHCLCYGGEEPGIFHHMRDIKGRREVDIT